MKNSVVFKSLFQIGVVVVIAFWLILYFLYENTINSIQDIQDNNVKFVRQLLQDKKISEIKIAEDKLQKDVNFIAKDIKNIFANYDVNSLKKRLSFYMIKNKDIEGIEVWDHYLSSIFLTVSRVGNKLVFTSSPLKITDCQTFESSIYYNKILLGKIVVCYDESDLYKGISKNKEKTLAKISTFNENVREHMLYNLKLKVIAGIVFFIIILFIISFLLNKSIHKPLQKLKKGLDEFFLFLQGKNQNIHPIIIESNDEFSEMAESLNQNIQVSAKLHNKILELNENLEKRIKDRTKELEVAKHKAEEASKLKSQFLANMSHEIRTPMNGITGMLYVLKHTSLNSEQKTYLDKISYATKSLLEIINDILDFSKIEAGKLEINKVEFSLTDMIDNIKSVLEFRMKEKNLEFEVDYLLKEDYFYGDSLRINQILMNLLTNAIKFTDNGKIKLEIRKSDENKIEFSVIDSGIGISKENMEKLFNPFIQEDGSITRKYGGTGLGLAISQNLAELMNGKIYVESKKGEGSKFIVVMELEVVKKYQQKDKKDIDLKSFAGNILLVEDNELNRMVVTLLFRNSDIEIDETVDGLDGLEKFKQNPNKYDLILMDLQMPNMNGFEASENIRKIDKDIPIIAVSANISDDIIKKIKQLKLNDYVSKPIDIEKLYAILDKYLRKKNLDK